MSLEDIYAELETHQEWLNSKGTLGLQANFKGIDLSGCNLKKMDLRGADFTEVNLQQANLEKANLQGANFQNAILDFSNLHRANLWGAYLVGASLRYSCLKKTWAKFTDLRSTTWEGAQLLQANFWGSNLEGSDIDQFTQRPLELAGVNFQEATWVNGERCRKGSVGRIIIVDVLSVPK